MKLIDLLKSRQRLARELNERRAAVALAERMLTLCDGAEKQAAALLTDIRKQPSDVPHFGTYRAPDEQLVNGNELSLNCEADAALDRVIEDLPAIREYWSERSKVAAAG